MRHTPVLIQEVLEGLDPQAGEIMIDGTVGDGGHAELILEKIGKKGKLYGIDQDPESLKRATEFLSQNKNFIPVQGNFRQLDTLVPEKVDGILLDLGWSTPQFKERGRGFSFLTDEPLDMRLDPSQVITASDIVNSYKEDDIAHIIRVYGEERHYKQIAKRIVKQREIEPIATTKQLIKIIGGGRTGGIHPATRTFQALRIAVNDELEALKEGIEVGIAQLKKGGRIAIISFHSLEDRIVKHAFRKSQDIEVITKRPIKPKDQEIDINPRARSAKLRIAKKVT